MTRIDELEDKRPVKIRISGRVSPSIYASAEHLAEKYGISISEVVERALKATILEDKKPNQDRFSLSNQLKIKRAK